jgi:hypothetical protein
VATVFVHISEAEKNGIQLQDGMRLGFEIGQDRRQVSRALRIYGFSSRSAEAPGYRSDAAMHSRSL